MQATDMRQYFDGFVTAKNELNSYFKADEAGQYANLTPAAETALSNKVKLASKRMEECYLCMEKIAPPVAKQLLTTLTTTSAT